ncbi:AAA family ATPase [Pleionea sp. CnH1-48]|uniref:AAA family ATPase n=1 Tax=Pleionea sp. CnH1-48 TaxID=2954494 RepID=UPI002096DB1F|nr:AAA family ATPase [Pleionea sp. CnH1-48]MCO7224075.1 AAA family ATPase [Pleionea sp. CnH1-48]
MMNTFLKQLLVDATPSMDDFVSELGELLPWLYRLQDTRQDSEWHGEGNVHIHTDWVLTELYQLLNNKAQHITGWRRLALILGTAFHDIAKCVCTKDAEINGVSRVIAPSHEANGRSYLAFRLMALELPYHVVWSILGLVGEHHMPKRLVVKNASKQDYWRLSRRVDCELVYWLEVADMKGRICPDLDAQLMHLEEFKLFCQEYDVWTQSFRLPKSWMEHLSVMSQTSQEFLYAQAIYEMSHSVISLPEEVEARYYKSHQRYAEVIILCGISGSGKSSYAKKHFAEYEIICLDDIRRDVFGSRSVQKNHGKILHIAKERLKAALRNKRSVVWDATCLREDFREPLVSMAMNYGALVTLIVFQQPPETFKLRNQQRNNAVPDKVIVKQMDTFQWPLLDDYHRFVVLDSYGETLYQSGVYHPAFVA